jgi:dihydroorotate dehydrogenase (fumarate)
VAAPTSSQLVSALMLRGPAELGDEFATASPRWGDEHDYDSVQEMRATMCLARSRNPKAFARGNYRHMLRAARLLEIPRAGH